MTIASYSDLTSAVDAWLGHTLVDTQVSTLVQLFEAAATRRLLTRQQETTTILVPSNPTSITITGAANNGSGLIRLTVSSSASFTSNQEVQVANVNGTTEANGSWLVTVISGTAVDLQSSTFTNTYVSGGTITALVGTASLPSDYLTWRRATWTGSPRTELEYVVPSYFEASFPSQPTDVPRFFMIEGSTLSVIPTDSTPIEFTYFKKIPSLASNSTNWLCTAYPDVYLFGTLCEAETFLVNDERVPMWKARRDEIFEEITRLDLRTRGPSAVRVMGRTP